MGGVGDANGVLKSAERASSRYRGAISPELLQGEGSKFSTRARIRVLMVGTLEHTMVQVSVRAFESNVRGDRRIK